MAVRKIEMKSELCYTGTSSNKHSIIGEDPLMRRPSGSTVNKKRIAMIRGDHIGKWIVHVEQLALWR